MQVGGEHERIRRFNLLRRLTLTALVAVTLVSALTATLLSSFLRERMLRQDAEITAGFVRSIVATENAYAYFGVGSDGKEVLQLQDFLDHLTRMPTVLRANIYAADRRLLWSSDAGLSGRRFEDNDELDEALRADLVVHSGIIDPARLPKSEHQDLKRRGQRFIENYIPIFDVHGRTVVGVVELYKVPYELFDAIDNGVVLIWMALLGSGLLVSLGGLWLGRRAQAIIEAQRARIGECEALALAGEMGSAIAYRLRHPLKAIRGSAESLLRSALPSADAELARDIVAEIERSESWLQLLLTYAQTDADKLARVDINALLKDSVADFARDMTRRGVGVREELAADLPEVLADRGLLTQLFGHLIAHALEAMSAGGELTLRSGRRSPNGFVFVEIHDNGPALAAAEVGLIFQPYANAHSVGLGLPLVRRVVERIGGFAEADSDPSGTAIRLLLPASE